jgi:hypothetical protein
MASYPQQSGNEASENSEDQQLEEGELDQHQHLQQQQQQQLTLADAQALELANADAPPLLPGVPLRNQQQQQQQQQQQTASYAAAVASASPVAAAAPPAALSVSQLLQYISSVSWSDNPQLNVARRALATAMVERAHAAPKDCKRKRSAGAVQPQQQPVHVWPALYSIEGGVAGDKAWLLSCIHSSGTLAAVWQLQLLCHARSRCGRILRQSMLCNARLA